MITFVNFTGEGNRLAVGRPARLIVSFVVIGNLSQSSGAVCIDDPHIRVAIVFVFFSGAVRNKRDVLTVGDHCGSLSFQSSPSVICFALPEFRSTTHKWVRRSSNQPVSLNL